MIVATNETLLIKEEDGVAILSLHRPGVYNSVNRDMALALQDAIRQCGDAEDIRAIVLTGDGKAFCAGQDLSEATASEGTSIRQIIDEHYNPLIKLLRSVNKPVIAAVNGIAAGAGANLALACDIIIATESASFVQAFSSIGLVPDSGGSYFLPRAVGFQKALAIAMLVDKISAKDACSMGMIYQYYPDETFWEQVMHTARKLAKMPTKGLALTKQLFNASLTNNLEEQLELEGNLQVIAGNTHDFREGVNAFLEKRKPIFKGL